MTRSKHLVFGFPKEGLVKDVNFDAQTVRVALHILAVCVWVGGQIVVGAIVPALKRANPDAVRHVTRAFGRIGWPFRARHFHRHLEHAVFTGNQRQAGMHYWASRCLPSQFQAQALGSTSQLPEFLCKSERWSSSFNFPSCARNIRSCSVSRCSEASESHQSQQRSSLGL